MVNHVTYDIFIADDLESPLKVISATCKSVWNDTFLLYRAYGKRHRSALMPVRLSINLRRHFSFHSYVVWRSTATTRFLTCGSRTTARCRAVFIGDGSANNLQLGQPTFLFLQKYCENWQKRKLSFVVNMTYAFHCAEITTVVSTRCRWCCLHCQIICWTWVIMAGWLNKNNAQA